MWPLLLKGFLLGWAVAWPPGPINAEMIRRGLNGGFLPALWVGLGACTGDFGWALAMSLGAGSLTNLPGVRPTLGVVSGVLLLFLAWTFGRGAVRSWRERQSPAARAPGRFDSAHGGFALGFITALTSPWNMAFWLAVVGSQATENHLVTGGSLVVAAAVLAGAAAWTLVVCTALQFGARFATPAWHAITQAATSALMLAFAVGVILRLKDGV